MALMRTNMADILDPIFRQIIDLTFKDWPTQYDKIFNIESSTKQNEKDSATTGLGLMALKSEGTGVSFDDPLQGYDTTYTHDTWGLGCRVTMEMYQDDQHRVIKKLPSGLARSARRRMETSSFNIFNRSFSGSYLGGDGKSLCSTTHPLVGGGAQSNRSSTDADFSFTAVQSAITTMDAWVDDRGYPIVVPGGKMILIHPSKKFIAKEILQSNSKPYTANNEINALMGEDLSYMISPWLTETGYWWIVSPKDVHEMYFFWRMRPKVDNKTDFYTEDLLWKLIMRFSVGWSHYMGVYGSAGS